MTEKVHVLNFLSDPHAFRPAETDLKRRARQIGTLAGRVVALLRQAQEKLNDEQTWNNLRSSAENRTEEWRQAAAARARQAAHDYPVHVALAAGLVGFLVGAALRVGRTHRAH